MTADQIRSLQPALAALLEQFRPFFKREGTFKHWQRYLLGLMADLKRRSVEPIALAVGLTCRTLAGLLRVLRHDAQFITGRGRRMAEDNEGGDGPPRDVDAAAYWRANLKLIAVLLGVWAVVSYVFGILLVELLNHLHIGSLPLGFWFAQQGAIYVFVVLIFVYAWRMDKLDRKFGMSE